MKSKYFRDRNEKRDMTAKPTRSYNPADVKKTTYKAGSKAVYTKVPSEHEGSLKKKTYTELYKLKRPPNYPEEIRELGNKLIEWCKHDDSIIIEEFSISQGLVPSRVRKLGKKDEYFAQCYEFARAAVAARRERIVGKDLMKAMHPLYHDDWKNYLDDRTRLSKNQEESQQNITFVMEAFPNSNLVPVKED